MDCLIARPAMRKYVRFHDTIEERVP